MPISSKQDYKQVLAREATYYSGAYSRKKDRLYLHIKKDMDFHYIQKFLRHLRAAEYYKNCKSSGLIGKWMYLHHESRKNRLGALLNFSISDNVLGEGAVLYHPGVVINPHAKIGENCLFHGNNCVGNKGSGEANRGAPLLGNGVELGFGAVVIGNVTLADNIRVGANAVVTRSFLEEGITLVGNPARKLEK